MKNKYELTDEEMARASSIMNDIFSKNKGDKSFGTQGDVKQKAYEAASMSYDDFLQGNSYEELAKRYTDKGKMAMQDTVGQVAARTGGIASSYATTAGQQAYGDWMTRLEETARAMYDSERQEAMDRYALSKGVLDMNNAAEDRQLALTDRLRAQAYEDEDRKIKAGDRQNTIRDAELTALYSELYYNPNAYATYADYMTAFPDSLVTEAEFNQTKGTATGKYADDNKETEDENADEIKEQTWLDAEVIWRTGGTITDEMRQILGLSPETEAAYAMYYAPEEKEPERLEFDSTEILEQLQSGNINSNTIKTYEETYGELYPDRLVRTGEYKNLTREDLDKIHAILGTEANTDEEIAAFADLAEKWYGYYGQLENKEKGIDAKEGSSKLKNRAWFVTDDGNFRDASGYRTYTESELIEALKSEGFSGKEAKKWIEENKEFWGYAS